MDLMTFTTFLGDSYQILVNLTEICSRLKIVGEVLNFTIEQNLFECVVGKVFQYIWSTLFLQTYSLFSPPLGFCSKIKTKAYSDPNPKWACNLLILQFDFLHTKMGHLSAASSVGVA